MDDATSRFDVLPLHVHHRQRRGERKGVNADPLCVHEGVANNIKAVGAALERLEDEGDVLRALDWHWYDLKTERARRRVDLVHLRDATGIAGIGQDRQPTETRENLAHEFEALGSEITCLV